MRPIDADALKVCNVDKRDTREANPKYRLQI